MPEHKKKHKKSTKTAPQLFGRNIRFMICQWQCAEEGCLFHLATLHKRKSDLLSCVAVCFKRYIIIENPSALDDEGLAYLKFKRHNFFLSQKCN